MKYPAEELKLGLQGGPLKEYQKILTFSTINWEHANKIFFSLSKRYIDKLCRILVIVKKVSTNTNCVL